MQASEWLLVINGVKGKRKVKGKGSKNCEIMERRRQKLLNTLANKPSTGPSLPLSHWKAPFDVLRNNQGVG